MANIYGALGNYYKDLSSIGYPEPGILETPVVQPKQELPYMPSTPPSDLSQIPGIISERSQSLINPNDISTILRQVMQMGGQLKNKYLTPPKPPAVVLPALQGAIKGALAPGAVSGAAAGMAKRGFGQIMNQPKTENERMTIENSRRDAIRGLINQGMTNPNEMKQILDESQTASGFQSDWTMPEILEHIKNIQAAPFLKRTPQVQAPTTSMNIPSVTGAALRMLVPGIATGGIASAAKKMTNPNRSAVSQMFNSARSALTNAIMQRIMSQAQ